jgi:hypothetical protein
MTGALMQLIAYDYKNTIMSDVNMYCIDLLKFKMIKNNIGINETIIDNCADSHMLMGIIFELNDLVQTNVHWKEKISNLIEKLRLNIFTYKKIYMCQENKYQDTEQTLFIGSIPLYLGNFKYIKNKIVVKFPNNFFSQYNYFLMDKEPKNKYKYELEISTDTNILVDIPTNLINDPTNLIKNIDLEIIAKFLINDERNVIKSYMKFFSDNPIQYCLNILTSANNSIMNNSLQIKINKIEYSRGFFISIPNELDGYVDKIVFNLKNLNMTKTIYFGLDLGLDLDLDLDNTSAIPFKSTDLNMIYWIGFNKLDTNPYTHESENITSCLTDPNDYIGIFFNPDLFNFDFEEYTNWIENIRADILVQNRIVGTNFNLMLKYVDGQFNENLEPEWIIKSNMNIDEKIFNIIKEYVKNIKLKGIFGGYLLKSHPEDYTIEKYLSDTNLIYLIKKYIGLN